MAEVQTHPRSGLVVVKDLGARQECMPPRAHPVIGRKEVFILAGTMVSTRHLGSEGMRLAVHLGLMGREKVVDVVDIYSGGIEAELARLVVIKNFVSGVRADRLRRSECGRITPAYQVPHHHCVTLTKRFLHPSHLG